MFHWNSRFTASKSTFLFILLVFTTTQLRPVTNSEISIGQQKQLLIDDHAVDSTTRLHRQLGEVVKYPYPILKPDLPGDDPSAFGSYLTVLRDKLGNKFQMWYMAGENNGIGYAESLDGIHWKKPYVSLDGKTNIVFDAKGHMSVSSDPHETDPYHRYKAAYYGPGVKVASLLSRRYSVE